MIDLSSSMRVGAAVLVLALAAGTPATAQAQAAADATSFRATVYGWFPGLSGTTEFPSGAAGPSLNVNAKNVVDSLKMVFMGTLEVQQGRWGGLVDWVYSDLGSTKAGTRDFVIHGQALAAGVAADLSLDVKTNILTLAGTYSFIDQPSYSTGLVFGARMLDMDQTLDWSFVGTGPAGLARTGRSEVSATNWDGVVARDISERKRMEAALLHAQKINSIGNLAGGIAHDFNNILASVLGSATILRKRTSPIGKLSKYLEIIETAARRGSSLTRQLLTFARKAETRAEQVSVNMLVKDTLQLFQRSVSKGIVVQTGLTEEPTEVNGDEGQIQQALLNLFLNARDSMPGGGTLTVTTECLAVEPDTTRGCNYRCTFCSIHLALGGGQYGFRKKPPADVVKLVEKMNGPMVMFWDDDLLSDPAYTRELCGAMKPLGKKWMSQMSATYVAHPPELLKTLKESVCSAMFLGIESINQDSLRSVDKQNSARLYEEMIKRIHDQGIDIHAGFICGLDHEDVFDFDKTAEWATKMGIAGALLRIMTPYPGTKQFAELKAADRILTTNWTAYTGEHVVYKPAKMTVEQLYWGHKWVKGLFYAYSSIAQRAIQRASQNGFGELLNITGCGLGYRSMFHLAADSAPVNVYRDMNHLPPQEEPVAYRFPYSPKKRFSFITDRVDQLRSKVQLRPRID